MKTVKMILVGILCVLFVACDKNNDDADDGAGDGGSGNNKLKTGQVEIKVEPNNSKKVKFRATAKKITIDWGDGTTDELTPNGTDRVFIHEYTDQNLKTILINTESLTNIGFGDYSAGGTYRELWVGDCSELEEIHCATEKLTVLEIKDCKALRSLNCYNNQLTATALNALFNSLPATTYGSISISGNPGAGSCDRSIATNKGWTFY